MKREVFVSYSHEDDAVVGELRAALEEAGLGVWTDQDGLTAGTDWRQGIESALAEAKVVVVVWTRSSVASRWVKEEAHAGQKKNKVIAALLDDTELPVGFVFDQAVRMIGWRHKRNDLRLLDLIEVVRARVEGGSPPRPRATLDSLARRRQLAKRAGAAGFVALVILGLFVFQDPVCGWSRWPNVVSDACGALDLGHRPTRQERLAWQELPPGCAALQQHLDRFPQGAHRAEALARLAAGDEDTLSEWLPATIRHEMIVEEPEAAQRDEPAARAHALGVARARADRYCKRLGIEGGRLRFQAAAFDPLSSDCRRRPDGVRCGFGGEAVCEMQQFVERKVKRCAD